MRRFCLVIFLLACVTSPVVHAQYDPGTAASGPLPFQKFEGTGTQTTASFQVPESWKLSYRSMRPLKITVYSSDGKIVMGTATAGTGTLYVPNAGTYYLRIDGF